MSKLYTPKEKKQISMAQRDKEAEQTPHKQDAPKQPQDKELKAALGQWGVQRLE